jgi:hypothetical protein
MCSNRYQVSEASRFLDGMDEIRAFINVHKGLKNNFFKFLL